MGRDLRDKLRRSFAVGSDGDTEPTTPVVRAGGGLREYLQRRRERSLARREPVALPEGEAVQNALGSCWLRRLRCSLDDVHGEVPLAVAATVDWARIAELGRDDAFAAARLESCTFVDTETTGLSGGAGTTVFLTGLAFVEGHELVLEQVFLRGFDEEAAALTHVAMRLAERPLQVTYVGKSFDRHRLHARMTIHRVASNVLAPLHLDLLYLARRAWGKELPDARLRTVEEHRLGLRRHDDLPGSEAPAAWLDWLRDRTGPVDRVLEHNRLDVLSLVALLGVLGRTSSA